MARASFARGRNGQGKISPETMSLQLSTEQPALEVAGLVLPWLSRYTILLRMPCPTCLWFRAPQTRAFCLQRNPTQPQLLKVQQKRSARPRKSLPQRGREEVSNASSLTVVIVRCETTLQRRRGRGSGTTNRDVQGGVTNHLTGS